MKSLGQYNNSIQDFVARLEFATLKRQQETVNWDSSENLLNSKNQLDPRTFKSSGNNQEKQSPKQISIDVTNKKQLSV